MYVAGGFENKIWIFRFLPGGVAPISPASPGPETTVTAPFIDVSGFATAAPSPRYNRDKAMVYPTGLAISPDGSRLSPTTWATVRSAIAGHETESSRLSSRKTGAFIYPYG